MSRLALSLVLLATACGGGGISLGGNTLNIVDTGYFRTTGSDYCDAMAGNQVELQIVDYTPVCDGSAPDGSTNHVILRMVFSLAAQQNTANPYVVTPINCTTGPAAPALAEFSHQSANFKEQATEGSFKFTNFDLTGNTPAKGTFNLTFPSGKVAGSFESVACN